jgi:hypothetical protein
VGDEDIVVEFSSGELHLQAFIRLERNDAGADDAELDILPGRPLDLGWIRLTEADMTADAFTSRLQRIARATTEAQCWCELDAWLKLLELLNVHPPLPDSVKWPSAAHG